MNTVVKNAATISNAWSLVMKNRIAQPATAKKFANRCLPAALFLEEVAVRPYRAQPGLLPAAAVRQRAVQDVGTNDSPDQDRNPGKQACIMAGELAQIGSK